MAGSSALVAGMDVSYLASDIGSSAAGQSALCPPGLHSVTVPSHSDHAEEQPGDAASGLHPEHDDLPVMPGVPTGRRHGWHARS
ncbi:hypothetical protein KUTG_05525 [Kutzneria sp. 744]|nr:hypothetical protein KUTG_05525 [Kutzneria sp. 744]